MSELWGQQKQEVSPEEFEDLRFLLVNTKRIFEISKEDERKVKIFEELINE